ncbi:MAG: hypothetical protein AAGF45_02345 [Pseudomonadota bacterium]
MIHRIATLGLAATLCGGAFAADVPDAFFPADIQRTDAPQVMDLITPYIGGFPETTEGRGIIDLDVESVGDALEMTLRLEGFLDDSVSGIIYRGRIVPGPEGWRMEELAQRPICARGAVSDDGRCP